MLWIVNYFEEEVNYAFGSVGLFVCLLATLTKNLFKITIKFYGGVQGMVEVTND